MRWSLPRSDGWAWHPGGGAAISTRRAAGPPAAQCVVAYSVRGVDGDSPERECAMARRRQLYEGKAKILFEGPEPGTLVQYFKDDATAGNGAQKRIITGKGGLNNRISEYLMMRLQDIGIPTHFVRP